MEGGGGSTVAYKGLRGYWLRRNYERLNGKVRRRGKPVELGSNGRRTRFWLVRPKLRLLRRIPLSPKKLMLWVRDAYVKMMVGFSSSRIVSYGYGGSIAGPGISPFGKGPIKEYDARMIIEIYKSILRRQGQLNGALGTEAWVANRLPPVREID